MTGIGGRSMSSEAVTVLPQCPEAQQLRPYVAAASPVRSRSLRVSLSAHRMTPGRAAHKEGSPVFGLFKKRSAKRPRLIEIQYRDLDEEPREGGKPYVYTWALKEEPELYQRVFVRGWNGESAPAVIVGLNASRPEDYSWEELAPVFRYATSQELEAARNRAARRSEKALKDEQAWLDMARRAAGLPTPGRARKAPPAGYKELPPVDGQATPARAQRNGNGWWRAFKAAERHGRPPEEVEVFASIARDWYQKRDAGQRDSSGTSDP